MILVRTNHLFLIVGCHSLYQSLTGVIYCTIRLIAYIWLIYALGHMYAETELEVQTVQAQVEAITNLALDHRKLRCI
jgi:hypothetical protein